jgi:hypothetical protein
VEKRREVLEQILKGPLEIEGENAIEYCRQGTVPESSPKCGENKEAR